jgi:glycosyltransferase involved in cell wall biosynthesis
MGKDILDQVLGDVRPDCVVIVGDPWMTGWLLERQLSVPRIAYWTIDGGPLHPKWREWATAADSIVTCTEFGKQVLVEGGFSGEVSVIPLGVSPETFFPMPKSSLDRVPDSIKSRFVVGYVGRNQPRKQIPILVRAFADFARDKPDAFLFLHTSAEDVGWDVVDLLSRHGLAGRAGITTGAHPIYGVHDDALCQIYNAFDVMALPSTSEGFGLPILEAMACGVPVIATDYSAPPELLEGRGKLIRIKEKIVVGRYNIEQAVADTGHLAQLLQELYDDTPQRARLSQEARSFAAGLTWERCVQAWNTVIGTLLRGAPPVPADKEEEQHRVRQTVVLARRRYTDRTFQGDLSHEVQQIVAQDTTAEVIIVAHGAYVRSVTGSDRVKIRSLYNPAGTLQDNVRAALRISTCRSILLIVDPADVAFDLNGVVPANKKMAIHTDACV